MQSKNLGLIIYIKPFKDSDLFVKILTIDNTILSGIIYGGNSSKKRSTYQLGYFLEFNQLKKNHSSVTSINGEITTPFVGTIINDKFKSLALLSIVSILNNSLLEGQKINALFVSVKNLINYISLNQRWITKYCEWLFYFLEIIGYGIDYTNKNHMKYYNVNIFEFQNIYVDKNSILFPHKLFDNNLITHESLNSFFTIFEIVYKKNHISIFNSDMPINFINFKKLILKRIKKK